MKRGVALGEHALEVAQVLAVGRPERGGASVEELPTLAHGPAHDPQPLGGVHHDLETAVILLRKHVASVHPEAAGGLAHLQLEGGFAPAPAAREAPGEEALGPAADGGARILAPKGAAPGDEAHALEDRGLALSVPAQEHVQATREIQPRLLDVPKVEQLQPAQEHLTSGLPRTAWA